MNKATMLAQKAQVIKDFEDGIITLSDRNAYLDDIDWEYDSNRMMAELNQVTSRGTLTIER